MTTTMTKVSAIDTTSAHPKMSDRYKFIPTHDIVNRLDSHGWRVSSVKEVKPSKAGNAGFQKHLVRFQSDDFNKSVSAKGANPEILLINSHNGSAATRFILGIFELVCENGLVVMSEDYGNHRILHKGTNAEKIDDAVTFATTSFPEIFHQRNLMREVQLSKPQINRFAQEAAKLRFDESNYRVMPSQLLVARHSEQDTASLWNVYNRVQENLMKGGFRAQRIETGKTRGDRRVKAIKDIGKDIALNGDLWALAAKYAARAQDN